MTKEKRLGRGLEALLGRVSGSPETGAVASPSAPHYPPRMHPSAAEADLTGALPAPAPQAEAVVRPTPVTGPLRVEIGLVDRNPYQPRQDFDDTEIATLAESLEAHGLLQPVVVRRMGDRYQLIAGERRFRAAVKAGWADVPVQLVEADDRELAELAIVENMQRKDLNPLEKAASFQRYLEQYGCRQEELASRLKLDRSTISNLIRLLELPAAVQDSLRQGKITNGHARALLPLGDEREQIAFCERIQQEGMSVRQTEALVQEMIRSADAEPLAVIDREGNRTTRPTSKHLAALEQELRLALGTKVSISHASGGRGKIVIHFANHDEFERLHSHLTTSGAATPHAQTG